MYNFLFKVRINRQPAVDTLLTKKNVFGRKHAVYILVEFVKISFENKRFISNKGPLLDP